MMNNILIKGLKKIKVVVEDGINRLESNRKICDNCKYCESKDYEENDALCIIDCTDLVGAKCVSLDYCCPKFKWVK